MLKKYLNIKLFFFIMFAISAHTVLANVVDFGDKDDKDHYKKKFTLNAFNHQGMEGGFTLSSIQNLNAEAANTSFNWQPNTNSNGLNSSIRIQQRDNATYVYPYKYKPAQPLLPKFKAPSPGLQ